MNAESFERPVVLNQPNSIQNMHNGLRPPQPIQGFVGTQPRGNGPAQNHLHELMTSDRVIIMQKRELMEILLGCETENKYDVLNEQNQVIFTVEESSEFCMRCWCGPLRPIFVTVKDTDGNPVIYLERPLACQDICCPCCLQTMQISSPPERNIGSITQKWNIRPELLIKNASNQTEFIVKGPYCQFSCKCGDVEFPIYGPDGISECGRISKRWRGVLHEAFTNADIFGVKFPPGINPSMKALLIGATFLVDYMYFEETHHG